MNDSFDILARENGKQIISFKTKDSIRLEVYTEIGKLIIDYHKWESEGYDESKSIKKSFSSFR